MAFDPTQIPPTLIEDYKNRRCGLLVGAGASMGAGLPSWKALLEAMVVEAVNSGGMSVDKAADYRALIAKGSLLPAATGLKGELSGLFADFIRRMFVGPKPRPTDLHRAMVDLAELQFVLTTNYDSLIEQAYRTVNPDITVCTFKDAGEVRRSLSNRDFFILKAHGDATKSGDGIILTDHDYRQLLFKEPAYQHMLATMFSMYSVIFVGASLTDPEINLMLNYVASTFAPESGPVHYAVLTKEETNAVERERWFKDFNLRVIPVSSADEHIEVVQFVKALAAA